MLYIYIYIFRTLGLGFIVYRAQGSGLSVNVSGKFPFTKVPSRLLHPRSFVHPAQTQQPKS